MQDDAPYTYAGANGKSVNNYDRRYRGFTTLREAITDSINIVTVKTLAQAGVSLGWQYVQEYGFTTVDSRDMNEALARRVYQTLNLPLPMLQSQIRELISNQSSIQRF